eukprot:5774334-Amphidinium_carterae.2
MKTFDIFSEAFRQNAGDLLPYAVRDRDSTPPRRPGNGYGGGGGGGPGDDPYGSPGGRDSNYNNRSPPRPIPYRPGGDGGGGGGDFGGGDNPGEPDHPWRGYVQEYRLNRDRKQLPALDIVENHFTIPAATMQQKILNWVRDATKRIGTWHLDAAGSRER